MLKISGSDENGNFVITGIFYLVDTEGIPLDIVLERLKKDSYTPNMLDFFDEAIAAGWSPKRAYSSILTELTEVYGEEYSKEWDRRFQFIIVNRFKDNVFKDNVIGPGPSDVALRLTEAFKKAAEQAVESTISRGNYVVGKVDGKWIKKG